jgi:hypothetical protein
MSELSQLASSNASARTGAAEKFFDVNILRANV